MIERKARAAEHAAGRERVLEVGSGERWRHGFPHQFPLVVSAHLAVQDPAGKVSPSKFEKQV